MTFNEYLREQLPGKVLQSMGRRNPTVTVEGSSFLDGYISFVKMSTY